MHHQHPIAFAAALFVAMSALPCAAQDFDVLIFSKTSGFRHGSISEGIETVQALGAANDFTVSTTEDAADFNTTNLAGFEAVIWLSTTGDVLNATQQAAFENYIRSGGGYVGVHAATDTEYGWPWYGGLIGGDAWFANHPSIQDADLDVVDSSHISTAHYPAGFSLRDEWYNFREDPTPAVNVLITIDETSYSGGTMGPGHPISWYHEYDGGRSWYTAMGHRNQTFQDTDFQQHLLGGILYAAGQSGTPVPASGPTAWLVLTLSFVGFSAWWIGRAA